MSPHLTLEQRIKFDHGLPIGRSLVRFTLGELQRLALVEICENGRVFYMVKPGDGDMYSGWQRVRGDKVHTGDGGIVVWAARDPEYMAQFEGEPVATVPVKVPA